MNSKKKDDLALELMDDVLELDDELSQDAEYSDPEIVDLSASESVGSGAPEGLNPPEMPDTLDVEDHDFDESDKTVELGASRIVPSISPRADLSAIPNPVAKNPSLATPTGVALSQSEGYRVAQEKVLDLEQEIERLRTENEELAAAGETLRLRADELMAQLENGELSFRMKKEAFESEKELLNNSLQGKSREVEELRRKESEYQMRLSSSIKKIRVRERELENRLELLKVENTALLRSKDEMILDLKRQVDHLNSELDNHRRRGQELNRNIVDKQEVLARTVKALRIALNMLESDRDPVKPKSDKKRA